jgi:hypothetical protein
VGFFYAISLENWELSTLSPPNFDTPPCPETKAKVERFAVLLSTPSSPGKYAEKHRQSPGNRLRFVEIDDFYVLVETPGLQNKQL